MIGAPRLVERTAELSALDAALRATIDGDGSVLAIRGAAGVGKTSLLRAVAERAQARGMRVLGATAGRLEIAYAFGVARQLLERELVTATSDERAQLLAGPARLGALALAEHDGDAVVTDLSSGHVHGLYWLIANLSADRPLLLWVDDLQWCDLGSLQFLTYLARRVSDLPVLIVVATRPDAHPLDQQTFATLTEAQPRAVLAPRPLTGAGVQAMLAAGDAHVPPALVARLYLETGGNPFLVRELARSVTAEQQWADGPVPAPETVARAIQNRVSAAGPDAQRLVGALVALGDGCALAEAAAVAELDPDTASAVAEALLRADVLAFGDGVGFAHPLIRTAVEDGVSAPIRSNWHAQAARVLAERGVDDERVAVQLVNSAPSGDRRIAALLATAGRTALGRGAPQTAARYLSRALDEGPAAEDLGAVLADLGTSLLVGDRFADAADVLRRARDLAGDDSELLDRTVTLWAALTGIGLDAVPEGVRLIEDTIAQLKSREARLMLESEFVNVSFLDPTRLQATWQRLAPFTDLRGETPAERRLLSMATIKLQYAATDSADVVADIAARAYRGGMLIEENPLDPTKWFWAVNALVLTDYFDAAEQALQRGAASATDTGSLLTLLLVEDLRGLLWLRRGRVGDAESEAREALDRVSETARTPVVRSLEISLVRWSLVALIAQGRIDDADALLSERHLDATLPDGPRQIRICHERGLLRLAQRQPKQALEDAYRLGDFHRTYGIESVVEAPWRVVAAQALAALHDASAAVETAEEHLTLARAWGLPRDVGIALRTRAQVETDLEHRVELLVQALSTLRLAPAPLELADTAIALGASLRRAGRRTEAKDVLAEGLSAAMNCGATALIERARNEVRLAGGHERLRALAGAGSLTPGERRIAQLAADGLSNRQIAQELFLSVRTAENTLRRVYQKLAITSRRDLADAMAGSTDL